MEKSRPQAIDANRHKEQARTSVLEKAIAIVLCVNRRREWREGMRKNEQREWYLYCIGCVVFLYCFQVKSYSVVIHILLSTSLEVCSFKFQVTLRQSIKSEDSITHCKNDTI